MPPRQTALLSNDTSRAGPAVPLKVDRVDSLNTLQEPQCSSVLPPVAPSTPLATTSPFEADLQAVGVSERRVVQCHAGSPCLPVRHDRGRDQSSLPVPVIRTRSARIIALIVLAVLGTASITSCGGSSAGGTVTLTLYNGQHEETTDALVSGFEKSTGIQVSVRSNDEDTLADEIVAEGSHTPADLIFTENSPALEYLQGKGLLARVDGSTLARVPSRFSSPQGDWVGVSARVSVLIYNPRLIAKPALPTSVVQLAQPRYAGELALAPGETDFQPIVTSMLELYGRVRTLSWLQALKANAGSNMYPDNETIADEVNRGRVAFGIVNQYYWYRMRAEIGASNVHSAIAYFAPRDPGYVVDVSGAGILKSSRHQAEAQRFLAYLVSRAGQSAIVHSISFEYTIARGAPAEPAEPPFDGLRPHRISVAQLGDGSQAIRLLTQAGLL